MRYALQDIQSDKFLCYPHQGPGDPHAILVDSLDEAALFEDKAIANVVACDWSSADRYGYLGSFRCVKVEMTFTPEPWF